MATKKLERAYTVSKRFTVWVEARVTANSLQQALDIRDQMQFAEFKDGETLDFYELPGGAVTEDW